MTTMTMMLVLKLSNDAEVEVYSNSTGGSCNRLPIQKKRRRCNRFSCYRRQSSHAPATLPLLALFMLLLPYFVHANVEFAETSLTEDLEESIRHSVKSEIEMEQEIMPSPIANVLKDIQEAEKRQEVAKNILSTDYTQLNADSSSKQKQNTTSELNEHGRISTTTFKTINDIQDELFDNNVNNDTNVIPIDGAKDNNDESIREARNLVSEMNENTLENISANENTSQSEETNLSMSIDDKMNEVNTFEEQLNANGNSLQNTILESNLKIANTTEITENINLPVDGETFESKVLPNIVSLPVENKSELNTPTAVLDSQELGTTALPVMESEEVLSVVLNETLTGTEPSALLFEQIDETTPQQQIEETTPTLEKHEEHIVIKKQGVHLDESIIQNESSVSASQDALVQMDNESIDAFAPTEASAEIIVNVPDSEFEVNDTYLDISPTGEVETQPKIEFKQSVDIQNEELKEEVSLEVTTETADIETSTVEEEVQEIDVVKELRNNISDTDEIATKGLRSIKRLGDMLEDPIATLFETLPATNAEQTLNDNLADESSSEIGKALLTRTIGSATMNNSMLVIVLCSSIAIFFVLIALMMFLISYKGQHGTLDIEMQEQRCGKDNLNDEDVETCTKLLEIELPAATSLIAEETDECL